MMERKEKRPLTRVWQKLRLKCFYEIPHMRDARFISSKNAAGIYEPFGQFDDGIGPNIPFGVCSTTDYSLLNAGIGFTTELLDQQLMFDFEITNLLNEVYRDFLDTYKGYSLSPGRSVNIRVNFLF